MNPRAKSWTKNLIKTTFVVALLAFLVKRGFISAEATKAAFRQWDLILSGYFFLTVTVILGIHRWSVLLRIQGIHLRAGRIAQLSLIGNFFNIALPGAVSGDVVKAIYVAREAPGRRAHALSSILFDRVVGVSGLVLIAAGALLFYAFSARTDFTLFAPLKWFVAATGIGTFLFYGYLFVIGEHVDPALRALRSIERRFPKLGSFTRIYEGIRTHQKSRKHVLYVLLLSILIHLLVIGACAKFALALGETQTPFGLLCMLVPLGLLVTAIPILPAGVGTGHAAFLALFHMIGSERGADLFTLFVLYQLGIGAAGGLVYLRFRSQLPALTDDPAVEPVASSRLA